MSAAQRSIDEAEAKLRSTSDVGLLKTFAALTHRLHANRKNRDDRLDIQVRAQRDRVEAEILRRMA